jgi:hypothetical protein
MYTLIKWQGILNINTIEKIENRILGFFNSYENVQLFSYHFFNFGSKLSFPTTKMNTIIKSNIHINN